MIEIPPSYTRSERKREFFGGDPYFRDAWDAIVERWPNMTARAETFYRTALVVFRPDAIVSRRVELALELFGRLGLRPVAVETFTYDRMKVREGWRYQLNIATRDRIDVMDMILTGSESILLLYMQDTPDSILPTSVWLSAMKGPSHPSARHPHHLRAMLGPAQQSVLTFVHISDEPADIIRELGAFLSSERLKDVLDHLARGETTAGAVESELRRQYARQAAHDIRMTDALERICADASRLGDQTKAREVLRRIDAIRSRKDCDWRGFLSACDTADIPIENWDRVAVAAALCAGHNDQVAPIIPDIGTEVWKSGA